MFYQRVTPQTGDVSWISYVLRYSKDCLV